MKLRERFDSLSVAILVAVEGIRHEQLSPLGKQNLKRSADMLRELGAELPREPKVSTEQLIRASIVDVLAQGGKPNYYDVGSVMHSRIGELWLGQTAAVRDVKRRSKATYAEEAATWETCLELAAKYMDEKVNYIYKDPPVEDKAEEQDDTPTRTVEDVESGESWVEEIPPTTAEIERDLEPVIPLVWVD